MTEQTSDDSGLDQDGKPVFHIPQRYAENLRLYLARGGAGDFDDLAADYARDSDDLPRFYFFHLLFDQLVKDGIKGDIAEIGVYKGNTARLLAWMARHMGTTAYLFDTYAGFDPNDLIDLDSQKKISFTDSSLAAVRARVGEENVRYIEGYFPETTAQLPSGARFSLVHIDCDLHAPIRSALEYFYPRMMPGGFIVVHDYSSLHWEGAEKAVDAFLADKPEALVPLSDLCGSAVIRKSKSGPASAVATNIAIGLVEHLGDIVACEPVVRHLKEANPGATVCWVVRAPYRELLDSNPHIDAVIVVECLTEWMIIKNHHRYDQVVDLHVNYRICSCCGIPLIKNRGNPFVDGQIWLDHGNLLESFSQGAGLPKLSGQPRVYIQEADRARVDALGLPEQFCVVHRRSNDLDKDWPDERWRDLISWMILGLHLKVVEVGQGDADPEERLGPDYRSLHGQTGILETAEVIRRAALLIAVDSGPAHLANAVGTPGVILLGRYKEFRAYNPFSGFYASGAPDVRIVRNLTGPAREIEIGVVQEAIEYILCFIAERDGRAPPRAAAPSLQLPPTCRAPTAEPASSAVQDALPRLLAFYLPQFHPIAENDAAHGAGFTEWNNVIAGKPLFKGHYQPRQPGELGYYDLRSIEVMRAQVQLARTHGITGFCFYHYYFKGKRLLYRPIENFIASDIDMPFCFLWANENWSKRWDGGDQEVIITQLHSREDDLVFLRGLYPIFDDRRYVRVDGRPLLLIYKQHLFPDIAETTERWRREAERAGYPGIYLVMVDDWLPHATNPRALGFDAAYEIPSIIVPQNAEISDHARFAFTGEFDGRIIDYHKFAEFHANRPFPEYKRFKTVMAPWDNTARYQSRAMVHVNTDNDTYRLWITKAYLDTYRRYAGEERLMFLHSWNEWCEGTYIEPDGRHGRRYLEETRDGVNDAIHVIRGARKAGFDLDAASLVNRIGREREEAYRIMLKSMRTEADHAWREAGRADTARTEAQALRAELEAARCEANHWRDEFLAMRRSTSWQVTWPLRGLKEILRTARRRP
ncbi:MAG TPA: glycoside hydrolase family 99-like domain-containing protein [Acetobacteraceae bacterium]|nr:glycoside hydrolase family 99-like domain-containing protein [Acetobacteraceae bacterium]